MERVEVDGVMTSNNILKACREKNMRPVCNSASYADGQCIIVGGKWHMSLSKHTKSTTIPRSFLKGTFTYCADGNNGWSYLDTGTNHRWSRRGDKHGDTLCVAPDRQEKIFVKKDYQFVRVEVKGYMTSPNILKTCQSLNMRPVCESKKYRDSQCRALGSWHMSRPTDVKKHAKGGLTQSKAKGAYFYCGENRNGGLTLLNTGVGHKWSQDKRDKNGDTFCVQHASMVGHGKCNCPSVNSLMKRANDVRILCLEKKANASNSSNNSLGEDDDDDSELARKHMARIAKAATPDPSLVLGETMHTSMWHLLSSDCEKECGDVSGLVRQIYSIEKRCGMLDVDLSAPDLDLLEQQT